MKIYCVAIRLSVALLFTALIPPIMGDDWSASCASNCTCKWTNGKKSAICSSLQLTTIPTTLSTELQVLVLNDNRIPNLTKEEFTNLGLLNLQRIYLKKSEIQSIHKETFKNLKILVEIDLSDNKIEQIEEDTFMGNDRLKVLFLNGNPLKRLVAYQFPKLPHLRSLDLNDCLINDIDPMALANLNLLEFLYLKNNLLESLTEYVFQHMTNLKTLELEENPWQCNCKLRQFRTWYVKSKVNSKSLTCKGPYQHKDKHWENVEEAQFGCPPRVKIFSNEDVQNIDIGSNTTFSCLVYGDPMPEVSWELNGKSLDNDNVLFDQDIITSDKVWSNLTVFNMTNLDAGTYSCAAQNVAGFASQNISIYLSEIVQHVLVKTPETFWYFGLIMGTFGTVFLLILISFVVCLCKRTQRQRRHPNKNIKGSVSFNDQEKKLLDLSITTTTNDRGDSCAGIDNSGPAMNKTESIIGFEPMEITVENHHRGIGPHHQQVGIVMQGGHPSHRQQQQQQQQQQQMMSSDGQCGVVGIPNSNPNQIPEEFPLNVGVFPPPPEFCSNVVTNPAYGNIFISVSVTQDMLDSSDINIYPDLLNIPKRVVDGSSASSSSGSSSVVQQPMLPVNVSSFATLPRNNQRRGILKKDPTVQTNLYPHDEIVSYHNLDTSYSQGYNHQQEHLKQQQQLQQQQQHQHQLHALHHHQQQQQQQQQQHASSSGPGGGRCSSSSNSSSGTTTGSSCSSNCGLKAPTCVNCMKSPPPPPLAYANDSDGTSLTCIGGQMRPLGPKSSALGGACLKYDNMGRRITASGNSTLSLPDEERLENETLFNEGNPLTTFTKQQREQQQQRDSQQQHQQLQQQQQQDINGPTASSASSSSSSSSSKQSQTCGQREMQGGSDFVSL